MGGAAWMCRVPCSPNQAALPAVPATARWQVRKRHFRRLGAAHRVRKRDFRRLGAANRVRKRHFGRLRTPNWVLKRHFGRLGTAKGVLKRDFRRLRTGRGVLKRTSCRLGAAHRVRKRHFGRLGAADRAPKRTFSRLRPPSQALKRAECRLRPQRRVPKPRSSLTAWRQPVRACRLRGCQSVKLPYHVGRGFASASSARPGATAGPICGSGVGMPAAHKVRAAPQRNTLQSECRVRREAGSVVAVPDGRTPKLQAGSTPAWRERGTYE